MMRNVNQVCGVLALIGVGCLLTFGSTADRIVTAAPGQIEEAGDTGQAIALGECNRCAWDLRVVRLNLGPGEELEVLPSGASGVFHKFTESGGTLVASTFDPTDAGVITLGANQVYDMRFYDGLRFRNPTTGQLQGEFTFLYRLD
jgi:hypothetical protein